MNILSMQQQPKWISSNGHAMYQVHLKELIFPNCNRHQALPPDLKMKSPLHLFLPPHPLSLVLSRYPVLEKNISHHTLYMRIITYLAQKELVYCIFGGHLMNMDGSLCTTIYQSREMRKTMSFYFILVHIHM